MGTNGTAKHRPRRSADLRWLAAGLVVALPVLAGCGGRDDAVDVTTTGTSAASRSATAASPATTAPSTTTAAAEPAPTGTEPVTDPAGPTAPAAVLTEIRTADHGSYDRVVFEFDRPFGGYTVQYVEQLTEDPTGDPVVLAGGAVLVVVVQGATLNNTFQTADDVPLATYGGPRRLTPGLPAVKEIADAGDFEAVLSFGIGAAARTGFEVVRLAGPDRLVVDVAH